MTRGRWALLSLALVVALGGVVGIPRAMASIPSNWTDLQIQLFGRCSALPCWRFTVGGNPAQATTTTQNITDLQIQSAVETSTGMVAQRIGFVDKAGTNTPPVLIQNEQPTPVQNPATPTETTLYTYTLPAGLLARDGMCVQALMPMGFVANGNGKIVRGYFGSASVVVATGAYNNVSGDAYLRVCRRTASTQTVYGRGIISANNPVANIASGTEDLTSTVIVKFTAQSQVAVPTVGEISATGFEVNVRYQ